MININVTEKEKLVVGDLVKSREDGTWGIVVEDKQDLNVVVLNDEPWLFYKSGIKRVEGQLEEDFKFIKNREEYDIDVVNSSYK
ncbi:hypothetical protein [Staphylococcus phage 812]|uniref:Uncharacterized protein n=2 Tax=Staphylococcus phage K TaxID=221915 RepID=V5UR96_BPPGK|nr:hypothetical protein CPT_phageK_gp061 [Staphylococcus phage K]YP_009224623.1 hypothetical protein ST812_213 [Staphylococcus phage 812]AVZ44675.1 hypothetical protein [Staphylococcus phage HYZ21]QAU06206.1 hypothetical protein JSa36_204 [Staphylococcus phage J-Sa36]QBX05757.1 hypothetical protein [Staphylococcus phage vBSP-A2]QEM41458.1 hypothetical protein CPT_Maine_212 [Staphylococcus phage Maine]URY99929.1 hypothetical protein SA4_0213 [Staphylococcus phage SA4_Green-2022a]WID30985.1 hy